MRCIWRLNCEQLARYDAEGSDKDAQIAALQARLAVLESAGSPPAVTGSVPASGVVTSSTVATTASGGSTALTAPTPSPAVVSPETCTPSTTLDKDRATSHTSTLVSFSATPVSSVLPPATSTGPCTDHSPGNGSPAPPRNMVSPIVPIGIPRRGKAPPVEAYTGANAEIRFEDWLPTLDCAASWNGWTDGESLMQLAGHLRGRALQEWNLLGEEEKATYDAATQALRTRLDPGNRVLAAQDF